MASQTHSIDRLPPSTPYVYMQLMQATRQPYPEKYIQEYFPEVGKVQSETCNNWKMILYNIKANNELVVAFEETNFATIGKVKDVVESFFKKNSKTIGEMGKVLDKWVEMQKRNITTFIGFSHGGYFATYVKPSWDVWRFTYNADQAKARDKQINFNSDKGITFLPNSHPMNYIPIGEGGHSFNSGAKNITPEKDWCDFDKEFPPR